MGIHEEVRAEATEVESVHMVPRDHTKVLILVAVTFTHCVI